jgi:hypothetical protein
VHPITASHDWIIANPVAMMLMLFSVSALLSLFAQEIKYFLRSWPIRTVRASTRNAYVNKLKTLEYLHENPYRLLLYLCRIFTSTVNMILAWGAILAIGSILIFHSVLPFHTLASCLLGMVFSTIWTLSITLKELSDYEKLN